MTFDFDRRLKTAMGLRAERQDLRNQQQALLNGLPRPQDRAAVAAAKYRAPAPSIIGGTMVDAGDTDARNAAVMARDAVAQDVDARRGLRDLQGSQQLDVQGIDAGFYQDQEMFADAPDFGPAPAAPPPMAQPPRPSGGRQGNSALRTLSRELGSDDEQGMMYGGVAMKPKMVKQPGYKCGGKVKMPGYEMGGVIGPEVTKWAGEKKKKKGMRGYAQGGKVTPDRDEQRALLQLNERGVEATPQNISDMMLEQSGIITPRGVYGGKVGEVVEDDGKDTVDVKVRQGEYMLNPETVGYMGGGNYEQGVQMLDDMVREATGVEPGPVPVNEDGEAERGFRRGGKMGYQTGGSYAEMPDGSRVYYPNSPRSPMRAGVPPARPTTAQFVGTPTEPVINDTRTRTPSASSSPKTANGIRGAVSGKNATQLSLKPVGRGIARGASALRGSGGPLVALTAAGQTAADTYFTPTADYYKRFGLDYRDASTAGEFGVRALGAASDLGANILNIGGNLVELVTGAEIPDARDYLGFRDIGADGMTARQEAAAAQDATAAAQDATAVIDGVTGQAMAAAPAGFRRAFTNELVENPNVVMQTGGPGDEVIIREDIDGVPTFTNLRRGGFDTSPAALQAQADARVAQDMGIRARNQQVVQSLRDSAPLYTQEDIDARDARNLAQAEVAATAARRSTTDNDDLVKSVRQRFQRQTFDEDGNPGAPVDDVEAANTFLDAMSQLTHSSGVPMTEWLESASEGEKAQVYEDFERVYANTQMALQAAAAQGIPASEALRTGANSLRMVPDREIVFGDVLGPEATLGDWWAGLGNDDPILNSYVEDPLSSGANGARAVIPARRLMRNRRGGVSLDALRDYGFLEE